MRGDSLRDFYAKTLALLGLSVLAGAGALVDSWPLGLSTPSVQETLAQADLPLAVAAPTEAVSEAAMPVLQESSRQADRFPTLRTLQTEARPVLVAMAEHSSAVLTAMLERPEAPTVDDVRLAVAPANGVTEALPASFQPIAVTALLAVEPEPRVLSDISTRDDRLAAPVATSRSGDASADGFITGAVKKTGASIVRTGVKTGASIADALRLVGGAFKKALP